MKKKKLVLLNAVIVAMFSLTACGSIPTAPVVGSGTESAITELNALSTANDFITLALNTDNPELAKELEALKDLSAEEKKAKLEELKAKYPDVVMQARPGKGGPKGPNLNVQLIEKNYPEAAAELKAIQTEHKAKMDALFAKYPDAFKKAEMPEQAEGGIKKVKPGQEGQGGMMKGKPGQKGGKKIIKKGPGFGEFMGGENCGCEDQVVRLERPDRQGPPQPVQEEAAE